MTDDSKELLPCPFCNCEASFEEVETALGFCWSAGCSSEDCIGYQSLTAFPRKCEAATAWNTRAPASSVVVSREKLKKATRILEQGAIDLTPIRDCFDENSASWEAWEARISNVRELISELKAAIDGVAK